MSARVGSSVSADLAAWVGATGTWVVGVVAGLIAYQQYRRDLFRPTVTAFRDEDERVVVRIINQGAGTGLVQEVNLLPPNHPRGRVRYYTWEVDGSPAPGQRLAPFVLPGRASAQLVLRPEEDTPFDGIRVRVDYGHGRDSGCIGIQPVRGHLSGTTHIPES